MMQGLGWDDDVLYESRLQEAHDLVKPRRLQEQKKLQGRREFQGLPISIENKVGSIRRGEKPDGTEWATKLTFPYGYIRGTEGVDGDHLDCFIGPNEEAKNAYVVHTKKPPKFKEYDEDKVMLGFDGEEEAKEAFLENYDDPRFYGGMDAIPMEEFRQKAKETKEEPQKLVASLREAIRQHSEYGVKGQKWGVRRRRKSKKIGRHKSDISRSVSSFVSKFGVRRLMDKMGDDSLEWNPEKYPRQALYEDVGLGPAAYVKFQGTIEDWVSGEPSALRKIRKASDEILRGRPTSDMAKALEIERAINSEFYKGAKLKLYRGAVGEEAEAILAGDSEISAPSAVAFTLSKSVARDFATGRQGFPSGEGGESVVVKTRVPSSRILLSYQTNERVSFTSRQKEIVVLGGSYKGKLRSKHKFDPEEWFESEKRFEPKIFETQLSEHGVKGMKWGERKGEEPESAAEMLQKKQAEWQGSMRKRAEKEAPGDLASKAAAKGLTRPDPQNVEEQKAADTIEKNGMVFGGSTDLGEGKLFIYMHELGSRSTAGEFSHKITPEFVKEKRSEMRKKFQIEEAQKRFRTSLREAKRPKLYYARSLDMFESDREDEELELLEEMFPDHKIVFPSKKLHRKKGMPHFHERVDKADLVVISPRRKNKLTAGVYSEARHARNEKIPVKILRKGKLRSLGKLKTREGGRPDRDFATARPWKRKK